MFLLPRWPDQSQMSCLKAFRVFLKCWPVPNTERNCPSERWLKGKDRKIQKFWGKFKICMFYLPSMMNCSCFHIWSYNFHYQSHSLICPQRLSERSRDNSRTIMMSWPTTWELVELRGDSALSQLSQVRLWLVELGVVSSASSLCFFLSANLQEHINQYHFRSDRSSKSLCLSMTFELLTQSLLNQSSTFKLSLSSL